MHLHCPQCPYVVESYLKTPPGGEHGGYNMLQKHIQDAHPSTDTSIAKLQPAVTEHSETLT
jgi:hypothetical protein